MAIFAFDALPESRVGTPHNVRIFGASSRARVDARARPPAMSTALGSTPGSAARGRAVRGGASSRYEDDDDDATETDHRPPPPPGPSRRRRVARRTVAWAGRGRRLRRWRLGGPHGRVFRRRRRRGRASDGDEEDGYDDDDHRGEPSPSLPMRATSRQRGGHAGGPEGLATSAWRPSITAAPGTTVKIVSRPLRA